MPAQTFDPRFAEYVTRVSFNLTLSKQQVYCLSIIEYQARRDAERRRKRAKAGKPPIMTPGADLLADRVQYSHFVPSAKGLEARGLISWSDPGLMKPRWARYPYELTEAGRHVFALLELAGLVRKFDGAANEQKAAA